MARANAVDSKEPTRFLSYFGRFQRYRSEGVAGSHSLGSAPHGVRMLSLVSQEQLGMEKPPWCTISLSRPKCLYCYLSPFPFASTAEKILVRMLDEEQFL